MSNKIIFNILAWAIVILFFVGVVFSIPFWVIFALIESVSEEYPDLTKKLSSILQKCNSK